MTQSFSENTQPGRKEWRAAVPFALFAVSAVTLSFFNATDISLLTAVGVTAVIIGGLLARFDRRGLVQCRLNWFGRRSRFHVLCFRHPVIIRAESCPVEAFHHALDRCLEIRTASKHIRHVEKLLAMLPGMRLSKNAAYDLLDIYLRCLVGK